MISKGDLVKMDLSIGGNGADGVIKNLMILGKVMNYCEEEDTYIVDPKVLSVPKEQVQAIERLPEDFDFNDVAMEMSMGQKKRERTKPLEIENIRFSGKS